MMISEELSSMAKEMAIFKTLEEYKYGKGWKDELETKERSYWKKSLRTFNQIVNDERLSEKETDGLKGVIAETQEAAKLDLDELRHMAVLGELGTRIEAETGGREKKIDAYFQERVENADFGDRVILEWDKESESERSDIAKIVNFEDVSNINIEKVVDLGMKYPEYLETTATPEEVMKVQGRLLGLNEREINEAVSAGKEAMNYKTWEQEPIRLAEDFGRYEAGLKIKYGSDWRSKAEYPELRHYEELLTSYRRNVNKEWTIEEDINALEKAFDDSYNAVMDDVYKQYENGLLSDRTLGIRKEWDEYRLSNDSCLVGGDDYDEH